MYINNDVIQVVRVTGREYKYDSIVLNEGSVLNGVILDAEEVTKKLKKYCNKLGAVTLVVDSSNIMVKKLQIPKLSKKKSLNIIKSEFDLGEGHEYVYDLNILSKDKKENHVLGCAVPTDFLEKYLEVFKAARLKIARIDVATNGMVKYISKLPMCSGNTFVMNIVVDHTLMSLLFENGVYKLSSRNRMFHEPGTEAYASELYSKFLAMSQLAKSQKVEAEITQSYYIGIDAKTMRGYAKYVRENDAELKIDTYRDMECNMEYVYALIGNWENTVDIDLRSIQKVTESSKKKGTGELVIRALALGILSVPIICYSQKLATDNAAAERQIEALQTYITAKEASLEGTEDSTSSSTALESEIKQYEWVSENVENSKYVEIELLEEIYGGKVMIESLRYVESSGSLNISGFGNSQKIVAAYSEGLRNGAYADEQYYSGHKVNDDNYDISIDFIWNQIESEVILHDED